MRRAPPWIVVIVIGSLSCASSPRSDGRPPAASEAPAKTPVVPRATPDAVAGKPAEKALEKSGIVAPSACAVVSIWPEEYSGSALVLEVVPHGSIVKQGDVLARVDTRGIDEQIRQAELEMRSAAIRHQATLDRQQIDEEAARWSLAKAKAALDRARRSLEGWKKKELAFSARSDEIGKRWEDAGLDDQKDELDQLEKMYKADELVDATEDIVLKRSRRRLELTTASNALSSDRRQYKDELEEAMQTETREEGVREQEGNLDRLVRTQEIDRRAREDAARRSADALEQQEKRLERLRRDRELLALRAPRGGVLLHGKVDDYRPGAMPPRYDRGSQLAMRADLFVIADADASSIALEITDADLARMKDGASVSVKLVEGSAGETRGTLHFEPYPRRVSPTEAVHTATVQLERPATGVLYGTRATVTPAATTTASASAPSGASGVGG